MSISIAKQNKKSVTFTVTGLNYKKEMITRTEVIKTVHDAWGFLSGLESEKEIKTVIKSVSAILTTEEVGRLKQTFLPTAKQKQSRKCEANKLWSAVRSAQGQKQIAQDIKAMSPCLLQRGEKEDTTWVKQDKGLAKIYGI